jgi:hypothetical protein
MFTSNSNERLYCASRASPIALRLLAPERIGRTGQWLPLLVGQLDDGIDLDGSAKRECAVPVEGVAGT